MASGTRSARKRALPHEDPPIPPPIPEDRAPSPAPVKKLSLLDFQFPADFANKSWVDLVDEEEKMTSSTGEMTPSPVPETMPVLVPPEPESASADEQKQVLVPTEASPRKRARVEKEADDESAEGGTPKEAEDGGPTKRKVGRFQIHTPKNWKEPKTGWCNDEKTLERRDKELNRMKERPTYKRYLSEVPKYLRQKGTPTIHPRTPNKFINHPRRSWDKQVRLWKLAIYEWAGETPTPSVANSACPTPECSDTEEEADEEVGNTAKQLQQSRLLRDVTVALINPDAMASMIGHFDMDTLTNGPTLMAAAAKAHEFGDESTLKAATVVLSAGENKGPTDFSELNTTQKQPK